MIRRFDEISRLAGPAAAWKWRLMGQARLSRFGLPPLRHTDHFIVGSKQSGQTLHQLYGVDENQIDLLPYPIDLEMFRLPAEAQTTRSLRCLWLGRIIPRKRLDLFLAAADLAIRNGTDLQLSIVGSVGFVAGYEKLIKNFPHPSRLEWLPFLPRGRVPELMHAHDVLVQPSEEENFGSSVAEAQACGMPVVIGATNGNADYLSQRDIVLADYRVETLARVFADLAARKAANLLGPPAESRQCAERNFAIGGIAEKLLRILKSVARVEAIFP